MKFSFEKPSKVESLLGGTAEGVSTGGDLKSTLRMIQIYEAEKLHWFDINQPWADIIQP